MAEYTGLHGALTKGVAIVGLAEFSVKTDRGAASHSRSGEESDIQVPGKLSVTGTISRIQPVGESFIEDVLDGGLFDLVGTLTDALEVTTITVTDCFMTSGEFKFADAGEMVSDNATFAVKDASATNPAIT